MQLPRIPGKKESHSGIRKGKSLYCSRWSLTDSWWRSQDMPAPANKGWCDMLGSPSSPTRLVQPLQHNPGCRQQPFGRSCFSDNAVQELVPHCQPHPPHLLQIALSSVAPKQTPDPSRWRSPQPSSVTPGRFSMSHPWAQAVPFPPWQRCHRVIPQAAELWQTSQGSTRGTRRDTAAIKHLTVPAGRAQQPWPTTASPSSHHSLQTGHLKPFPKDITVCKGKMTWHSYLDMI